MSRERVTETLDKLFLEISQFTSASTRKEVVLAQRWNRLHQLFISWISLIEDENGRIDLDLHTLKEVQKMMLQLEAEYATT